MAAGSLGNLVVRIQADASKLKSELNTGEKKVDKFSRSSTQKIKKLNIAFAALGIAAALAIKKIATESIKATAKFERWTIQMRTFTSSMDEAEEALRELIDFSIKTPFTPEEVIGAGKILKPLEKLGFQIEDLLTAAGNAAAAFGIGFQESALQIVRSFTAGIGAADLFRDRGVRSFIEINKGIDLTTLSIEELRATLLEALTTGDIGQAIQREALSLQGRFSTLQGELFLLSKSIGDVLEPAFRGLLETMLKVVTALRDFIGLAQEGINLLAGLTETGGLQDSRANIIAALQEQGFKGAALFERAKELQAQAQAQGQADIFKKEETTGKGDGPAAGGLFADVKKQVEEFNKTFLDMSKSITAVWSSTVTAITTGFAKGITGMILEGKNFQDAFKDFVKNILEAFITAVAQMIAKWLILMVLTGGTGGAAGGIGGFLKGLFGKDGIAIPARRGLLSAQGGAVTTGGFGEGGIPALLHPNEIIAPLDKFFESLSSARDSGGINITINGNVDDPQEMAELISTEVQRNRRDA